MISFTLDPPNSSLSGVANFFAFIGLMLEISVTFLGATHSVFLQRKAKKIHPRLEHHGQMQSRLEIVLKYDVPTAVKLAVEAERDKLGAADGSSNRGGNGNRHVPR